MSIPVNHGSITGVGFGSVPVTINPSPVPVTVEPSPVPVTVQPSTVDVTVQPSTVDVTVQPSPVAVNVNPTPVNVNPTPVNVNPTPVAVNVNPTPVNVNPTPVNVNPTPVNVNPTPVNVNPTPVTINNTIYDEIPSKATDPTSEGETVYHTGDKKIKFHDGTGVEVLAAEGHTHTKSEITDFAHTHTKSEITDFDDHNHGPDDINHAYASEPGTEVGRMYYDTANNEWRFRNASATAWRIPRFEDSTAINLDQITVPTGSPLLAIHGPTVFLDGATIAHGETLYTSEIHSSNLATNTIEIGGEAHFTGGKITATSDSEASLKLQGEATNPHGLALRSSYTDQESSIITYHDLVIKKSDETPLATFETNGDVYFAGDVYSNQINSGDVHLTGGIYAQNFNGSPLRAPIKEDPETLVQKTFEPGISVGILDARHHKGKTSTPYPDYLSVMVDDDDTFRPWIRQYGVKSVKYMYEGSEYVADVITYDMNPINNTGKVFVYVQGWVAGLPDNTVAYQFKLEGYDNAIHYHTDALTGNVTIQARRLPYFDGSTISVVSHPETSLKLQGEAANPHGLTLRSSYTDQESSLTTHHDLVIKNSDQKGLATFETLGDVHFTGNTYAQDFNVVAQETFVKGSQGIVTMLLRRDLVPGVGLILYPNLLEISTQDDTMKTWLSEHGVKNVIWQDNWGTEYTEEAIVYQFNDNDNNWIAVYVQGWEPGFPDNYDIREVKFIAPPAKLSETIEWFNIRNKPTIPTVTSELTNDVGYVTGTNDELLHSGMRTTDTGVAPTRLGDALQDPTDTDQIWHVEKDSNTLDVRKRKLLQWNGTSYEDPFTAKADVSHTHTKSEITDFDDHTHGPDKINHANATEPGTEVGRMYYDTANSKWRFRNASATAWRIPRFEDTKIGETELDTALTNKVSNLNDEGKISWTNVSNAPNIPSYDGSTISVVSHPDATLTLQGETANPHGLTLHSSYTDQESSLTTHHDFVIKKSDQTPLATFETSGDVHFPGNIYAQNFNGSPVRTPIREESSISIDCYVGNGFISDVWVFKNFNAHYPNFLELTLTNGDDTLKKWILQHGVKKINYLSAGSLQEADAITYDVDQTGLAYVYVQGWVSSIPDGTSPANTVTFTLLGYDNAIHYYTDPLTGNVTIRADRPTSVNLNQITVPTGSPFLIIEGKTLTSDLMKVPMLHTMELRAFDETSTLEIAGDVNCPSLDAKYDSRYVITDPVSTVINSPLQVVGDSFWLSSPIQGGRLIITPGYNQSGDGARYNSLHSHRWVIDTDENTAMKWDGTTLDVPGNINNKLVPIEVTTESALPNDGSRLLAYVTSEERLYYFEPSSLTWTKLEAGSSTPINPGAFDLTTLAGAAALYSLRLCHPSYTGPVVDVRRSSDDVVVSVYVNKNKTVQKLTYGQTELFGSIALQTWAGDDTLFVTKWYDQSGNGHHLEQTVLTNQPQTNKTLNHVHFNGSEFHMSSPTAPLSYNDDHYSYAFVWEKSSDHNGVILEQNSSSNIQHRRSSMLIIGNTTGFNGQGNDNHTMVTVGNDTIYRSICSVSDSPYFSDNGSGYNIRYNLNGVTTYGNTDAPGQLEIGDNTFLVGKKATTSAEYFHGYLYEVLVYRDIVSPTVETSLDTNWSSQYTTPGGGGGAPVNPTYSNTHSLTLDRSAQQYGQTGFAVPYSSDVTYVVWFKSADTQSVPKALLSIMPIFGSGTDTQEIYVHSNQFWHYIAGANWNSNNGAYYQADQFFDGNWHMLAVVMEMNLGATKYSTWYIDNQPRISNSFGSYTPSMDPTLMLVGAWFNGQAENWDGSLDDIGIWDKALTEAEINAIYNNGAPIDLSVNSGNYQSSGNLKAWYTFNSQDGTDGSGNTNTLTLYNSPTFAVDVPGGGGGFTNTKSLAGGPLIPGFEVFSKPPRSSVDLHTFSLWLKYSSSGQQQGNVGFLNMTDQTNSRCFYFANITNSTCRIRMGHKNDNDVLDYDDPTLLDGSWHHLAFVVNANAVSVADRLAFYVDGIQVADGDDNYDEFRQGGTAQNIIYGPIASETFNHQFEMGYIGWIDNGSTYLGWPGNVDEISFWDSALTAAEISTIYNNGSPIDVSTDTGNYTSSSNLQGWWQFENNIYDSSVHARNLTVLSGTPTYSTDIP